jgi:hypothetical protein
MGGHSACEWIGRRCSREDGGALMTVGLSYQELLVFLHNLLSAIVSLASTQKKKVR